MLRCIICCNGVDGFVCFTHFKSISPIFGWHRIWDFNNVVLKALPRWTCWERSDTAHEIEDMSSAWRGQVNVCDADNCLLLGLDICLLLRQDRFLLMRQAFAGIFRHGARSRTRKGAAGGRASSRCLAPDCSVNCYLLMWHITSHQLMAWAMAMVMALALGMLIGAVGAVVVRGGCRRNRFSHDLDLRVQLINYYPSAVSP